MQPLPKIDPDTLPIEAWLPVSRKEMDKRGWEQADIILISGDAYVDHPSFGIAVIGRTLEAAGYRVAILPQPNWRDDLRDFRKLGRPRLFFGVSAGSMDSMVNHYTARKRLRSNDAYTPGGQAGFRPDYPTIVYSRILKEIYPDVPVVVGGIEASMRRITHYDYWQDRLRPSFLVESGADLLVYGMGEKPIVEIARQLERDPRAESCRNILQVSYLEKGALNPSPVPEADLVLEPHERCLKDKRCQAGNFAVVETASNMMRCGRILQETAWGTVVVNPPFPFEPGGHEIDKSFDLPYTRLPHPRYKNRGEIPAFTMIQNSITLHRGCFGGCSFCTISAHQGKHVHSRSEESVLKEIQQLARMPYFKGNLSDLGGPSANMYGMHGKDLAKCARCKKPSCLFPSVCPNLNPDHKPLLDLYRKVASLPGVRHVFIGSGVRYDMLVPYLDTGGRGKPSQNHAREYAQWLIENGVSGRLKVAPEHTEAPVLERMRKMPFAQFEEFKRFFDGHCRRCRLNFQLIPYFISAHPGCTQKDMERLQEKTRHLGYKLEQVQLFTPTPMTLSTETYYTGLDPYTLKPVFTERDFAKRDRQTECFFWYKIRK
ncbi:MAG: YgiQ family radical SAM protein [Bacteroides sp.]|nr:YgiQ family radical SAM protein [Bacteroides sp.]MCM1085554.1 YgiQ family radical SAM protein [Bacteroides sp.]